MLPPHPHSRALLSTVVCLASLSDELSAEAARGGDAAFAAQLRLLAAVTLLSTLVAGVLKRPGGLDADMQRFVIVCLLELLLGPGRAALASCAAGTCQLSQQHGRQMLHVQALLMRTTLALAAGQNGSGRAPVGDAAPDRVLATHAAPAWVPALLAWLPAATDSAFALHGDSLAAGNAAVTLPAICAVAFELANLRDFHPAFKSVPRFDSTLKLTMAHIALRVLHTAAVAAQLPAERRPPTFSWDGAHHSAAALTDSCSHKHTFLEAAPSNSDVWRLAQSAAQLIACAPARVCDGFTPRDRLSCWYSLHGVLCMACSRLRDAPPDLLRWRRLAPWLRDAMARLPDTLLAMTDAMEAPRGPDEASDDINGSNFLCEYWSSILTDALCPRPAQFTAIGSEGGGASGSSGSGSGGSVGDLASAVTSCQEMAAWCTAGAALLQGLPQVAALAEQHTVASDSPDGFRGTSTVLAAAVVQAGNGIAAACQRAHHTSPHLFQAAEPELLAAAEAVWELHTACCRAAHWQPPSDLESSWSAELRGQLLVALLCLQDVAENLNGLLVMGQALAQQPHFGGANGLHVTTSALASTVAAMSAAGLATIPELTGPQPDLAQLKVHLGDEGSRQAASVILTTAERCCPAALLLSEPLQKLLFLVIDGCCGFQLTTGQQQHSELPLVLELLSETEKPLLVAWLVERGVMDSALLNLSLWGPSGRPHNAEDYDTGVCIVFDSLECLAGGPWPAAAEAHRQQLAAKLRLERASYEHQIARQVAPSVLHARASGAVDQLRREVVMLASQLAETVVSWYQQPEQQAEARQQLARAAAVRACANLRCANVGLEGGPGFGQGQGCKRCSGCLSARYCCTACAQADWRAGHRRVCSALAAERQQRRAGRGEQEAGR